MKNKKKLLFIGLFLSVFFLGMEHVHALGELDVNLNTSDGSSLDTVGLLILMTILSFLPSIIMTMTSFTRFIIVFSFMRSALGTQNTPPNQVLIGLALIMSFFVFAPTFDQIKTEAYEPYTEELIDQEQAMDIATGHMKGFMSRYTRINDLELFAYIAEENLEVDPDTFFNEEGQIVVEEIPMYVLLPSFIISELKTAFEIGFMLFIPFIMIDIVVASILMSMGMFMMPPAMIALPFKILLFVMVDGWHLLIESMIRGMMS
jgi:flagellar biosynthetic protein FliP